MSAHQEQLTQLYLSGEHEQLHELAAALELEPWVRLVSAKRRYDEAFELTRKARSEALDHMARRDYVARHHGTKWLDRVAYARAQERSAQQQLEQALIDAKIDLSAHSWHDLAWAGGNSV